MAGCVLRPHTVQPVLVCPARSLQPPLFPENGQRVGQITTLILQIRLPENGDALQRELMRVSALPCFPLELRMVYMDACAGSL